MTWLSLVKYLQREASGFSSTYWNVFSTFIMDCKPNGEVMQPNYIHVRNSDEKKTSPITVASAAITPLTLENNPILATPAIATYWPWRRFFVQLQTRLEADGKLTWAKENHSLKKLKTNHVKFLSCVDIVLIKWGSARCQRQVLCRIYTGKLETRQDKARISVKLRNFSVDEPKETLA